MADGTGVPMSDAIQAIALAPEQVSTWIESELRTQNVVLHLARTVGDVVDACCGDAPQHPQILIVDFDTIGAADAHHLHAVRDLGWFGVIIALGEVPEPSRFSLQIEHVLRRPLRSDVLCDAVARVGLGNQTTRMPTLQR